MGSTTSPPGAPTHGQRSARTVRAHLVPIAPTPAQAGEPPRRRKAVQGVGEPVRAHAYTSRRMADKFRILQSPSLERAARDCPLLDNQSDREAWVECCTRRFLPLARRFAAGDELAREALQESWIRVLLHVCEYHGSSPACAWVRTIVHNCALDLLRNQRRPSFRELSTDVADPALGPEALAAQHELHRLLREMVAALPAAYRTVYKMRIGEDLSTAETARRLGISPSNVSTRLERAVKMLQRSLDARLNRR